MKQFSPIKSFEWFISYRYLRGKRKSGFVTIISYISVAGVFLGTLALVVALSIANGFEKEVRDRIVGTNAHARIVQYHGNPVESPDSLRAVILKQPHVLAAAPFISGKGGIERYSVQEGVLIMGVDPVLDSTVTEIADKVTFGTYSLDSAESDRGRKFPGVIIGIGLADKLGIRQGAEVVLGTLTSAEEAVGTSPTMARFTVTGVFETGMYEYDLSLVYVSILSAQMLFNTSGVEGIEIKTSDILNADIIGLAVRDSLGGYPYRVIDWKSQNKSLFKWMKLEKLIIFIVISMIILIAAFNIVSSLIMMIVEKKREIGILMGMGASTRSIVAIFMLNGIIVGFIGSTLGTFFGVTLCLLQMHFQFIPLPGDIYFINKLPVLIEWFDIFAVYGAANVICALATLYPAWTASQVLPAESIRHE